MDKWFKYALKDALHHKEIPNNSEILMMLMLMKIN